VSRKITIGVCNDCQSCDLMKYKLHHNDSLPYCTLFKTFLQFREYSNENQTVRPCYECLECSDSNTHYFTSGEYAEE
jgi:hypothetical protein